MTKGTKSAVAVVALLVAMLVAMAAPALAVRPGDHANKGKSGSHKHEKRAGGARGGGITEDNDTNDSNTPNNVADEGDNLHPSGKDRSVEHGGSGNQGSSASTPDQDGHGPDRDYQGTDKPDGPGGVDLADQDGNNGCGNDDDFEDDNEGWCGHKPKPVKDEVAPADVCAGDMPAEVDGEDAAECGDVVEDTNGALTPDEDVAPVVEGEVLSEPLDVPEDDVLGLVIQRAADKEDAVAPTALGEPTGERAALPFTGSDVLPLVAVGLVLLVTGIAATRVRRN